MRRARLDHDPMSGRAPVGFSYPRPEPADPAPVRAASARQAAPPANQPRPVDGLLNDLKLSGWMNQRIAQAIGCNEAAVWYWRKGHNCAAAFARKIEELHARVVRQS